MKLTRKQLNEITRKYLLKEMFGFLPLILGLGCEGKGGLEHNHFTWAYDNDSDGNISFLSTVDGDKISDEEGFLQINAGPNQGFKAHYFIVKISGLNSEYLTPGVSVYQGNKDFKNYGSLESGQIYEILETHEENINGNISTQYSDEVFTEEMSDECTLCFLNTSGKLEFERDCSNLKDLVIRLSHLAGGISPNDIEPVDS